MIWPALWSVAGLLALAPAAAGLAMHKRGSAVVYGASLVLTSTLCAIVLYNLLNLSHLAWSVTLPIGLPWLGAHFRLDPLASFFLVVVNLGGAAASLFALGYGRHEQSPGRVLPFFPAYLAGMNIVVLADDAFSFLVAWEFMSLTSWALVVAHHRDAENVRAGYVYLLMASFGTLALLLAFGVLAGSSGHYDFDTIRNAPPSATLTSVVLLLSLVGAGSKAGLVPLHAWLPLAHPAAPSHVSGLMSGVMTKVAVYGFVRIVFDLLGPPEWWWSMVVLGIGGPSATLGVLYALMQRDIKRVLAYSTIENIGIVFVGLGLALAFKAEAMNWVAALAFTAALLHVFNHALFKSLLFFGAGCVLNATGERDMEKLGGLIHGMPQTAFAVLVGCVAISALPPFNGFVSEWLTFQAILLSPQLPSWTLRLIIPADGGLLALAAALAAACFVKLYGVSFLGRARNPVAATAQEADRWSLATLYLLALLCLVVGIVPGLFIDTLAPVAKAMVGDSMPHQARLEWLTIVPIAESHSSYNGLLVLAFILLSGSMASIAIHRFASDRRRRAPAWDCGYPDPNPAIQYSASSFSQPIRRVFSVLVGAREHVAMPAPGDTRPARLTIRLRDLAWDTLYAPVPTGIWFATEKLNHLQFLSIRQYLSLVFAALVVLLLGVSVWS
jgi:hydrogenase-4 component B